jgi:outer membrane beta-barrel protein
VRHAVLAAVFLFASAAVAQTQTEEEEVPGSTQAIQERAYRLTYEIAAGGGLLPVDVYTKSAYVGGAMVIHFTDVVAWQFVRGGYAFNWSSSLRQQLERDFQVLPTAFHAPQFFIGSQLMFNPFYGKSEVANRFVIHYEAYIEVGGSVIKYTDAFRPAVDVGGGLRVFQNKVLSYRLEVLDTIVLTGGIQNAVSVNLMLCLNIGSSE